MNSSRWTLKILSGTHMGAEIPLGSGEFSIGTGDHCDLVLHDPSLQDEIGQIRIEEDKVTLLPHGSQGEETYELTPNETFAIGGLSIGVMPTGEAWHELDEALMVESDAEMEPGGEEKELDRYRHRRKLTFLAIVVVFLLVGIFFSLYEIGFDDESLDEQLSRVSEVLPPGVIVKRSTSDRVIVKGHVASQQAKKTLEASLNRLGVPYQSSIELQSTLIQSVRLSLDLQKMHHIEVNAGEDPGTIVLKGFVKHKSQWVPVLDNLKTDIKGVKKWIDQVDFSSDRAKDLKSMLEKRRVDTVDVAGDLDHISLKGSVPEGKVDGFRQAVKEYQEKYDNTPPLKTAQAVKGKFEVQSVHIGDTSYIVTKQGKILMVGAQIEKGVVIEAIHADKLILRKGGQVYTHPLD